MYRYERPKRWLRYDTKAVIKALVEAKSAVQALTAMPYQKSWVQTLQLEQMRREAAATSRIAGGGLTERELDTALQPDVLPDELHTRSQRQARAAMLAHRWIAEFPPGLPITAEVAREVHRRLVTGCDEDHCLPGVLRGRDSNVVFGTQERRGAEGGSICAEAFAGLFHAVETEFRDHDPLVQAMAMHYHLAAIHPFLDGNGRTARAMETLLLCRAGLTGRASVAMSIFYEDEKLTYLRILNEVGHNGHDLTPFLIFALQGVRGQCDRLTLEIRGQMQRALFRDTMNSLFNRPENKRKRVMHDRQIEILKLLLEEGKTTLPDLQRKTLFAYRSVQHDNKAFARDVQQLELLQAIHFEYRGPNLEDRVAYINLDWPQEMDESDFLRRIQPVPQEKALKIPTVSPAASS
ncbi:MAG: Fic family protein [Terracidiphilus sp.]|jgi:Fic family protein